MKNHKQKYKAISFSTTIRNPGRYTYFLRVFKESVGERISDDEKLKIQKKLIKKLIYRPTNGPNWYKEKIKKDIELNEKEADEIMYFKKRTTSWSKRFDANYKALEFLGLIQIKNEKLFLTKNGEKLLNNSVEIQDGISNIYSDYLNEDIMTNILLKIQTNSPLRKNIKNKVNFLPFLINLINTINSTTEKKGISKTEFIYASLAVSNNYQETAKKIIETRKNLNYKKIEGFKEIYPLNLYEKNKNFWKTLEDYSDSNIRMYKTTGLIKIKGGSDWLRIDLNLSEQNRIEKIIERKDLLENKIFVDKNSYINNLNSEYLFELKKNNYINSQILIKEISLGKNINVLRDIDKKTKNISDFVDEKKIKLESCIQDLKQLTENSKPSYQIMELKFLQKPLALEFLISLILFLKYRGTYQIIPNLIFDDYNLPSYFASGNKGDIICFSKENNKNFLIEVTLIKNKKQQINNETTTITRHLSDIKEKYSKKFQCVFLAPIIHSDTKEWFRFQNRVEKLFLPLKISEFIEKYDYLFIKYDKIYEEIWNIKNKI